MAVTLIIGYGNPLRGDDAAGLLVAESLREMDIPDIEVIAVHQLAPELAEPVSRAGLVIFVDACMGPEDGGLSERPVRSEVEGLGAFTHHSTPEGLLAAAQSLYGRAPEAVLISIPGSDFSCSVEPSDRLRRRVEKTVGAVLSRCAELRRTLLE